MKKYKTIRTKKVIQDKIICNKCGKKIDIGTKNYVDQNLFHSFQIRFGYGSKHDFERWDFDICESCLLDFIKTFRIQPEKKGYL